MKHSFKAFATFNREPGDPEQSETTQEQIPATETPTSEVSDSPGDGNLPQPETEPTA